MAFYIYPNLEREMACPKLPCQASHRRVHGEFPTLPFSFPLTDSDTMPDQIKDHAGPLENPALLAIKGVIDKIIKLGSQLPDAVPIGTQDDKLWTVMNMHEEDPWQTFNRRFDIVFGENCRDKNGRLYHLRRGFSAEDNHENPLAWWKVCVFVIN